MLGLLVDDDEDVLDLLETVLAHLGHEVMRAGDAATGLAAFAGRRAELVVLDWRLPGMDGLEACRRLRALPGGDACHVLVITAHAGPEVLAAALEAGADDYLPKPFEPETLRMRLSIATENARHRAQRHRAEAELRARRDALEALLDALRAGAMIAGPDGRLGFVNRAAGELFGLEAEDWTDRGWAEALPLPARDRERLRAMAERPAAQRDKVEVELRPSPGRARAVEIDVRDDPRAPGGRCFFVYDVSEVAALRRQLSARGRLGELVGRSPKMTEVYETVRQVAPVDSTVLILGETGTGKELVARALHEHSRRADGPLIPVNCAGLTESILNSTLFGHRKGAFTGADADQEGLFEAANGGTIFLDELGDIPMSVQTRLLRVLQEREITRVGETRPRKIDVRVLAATHRDLAEEIAAGRFREDLLYRLRVVTVRLPPLRERREDIPLLVDALLEDVCASLGKRVAGPSHDTLRVLMDHRWPGNVRELRSCLEAAVIRCRGDRIEPDDLPPEIDAPPPPRPAPMSEEDERVAIHAALEATGGNRTAAAKVLGISRATFYRRLTELDIQV